jgi:hypothetical protein
VFDHDDTLRCSLPPGPSSVDVDESAAAGILRYYLLSVHDSAPEARVAPMLLDLRVFT